MTTLTVMTTPVASRLTGCPVIARDNDNEMMRRLEAGDADALAEIQERHRGRIERLIRTIVQDRGRASDLTYEVFAKVFLKSHLYRPGTNFTAWLSEVARNHTLSSLRRRAHEARNLNFGREAEDHAIETIADPRVDRGPEEAELMAALETAVQKLPPSYREVFELCVRGEVPYKTAAERLQVPTGTVAIRIMRARQRLYQAVEPLLDRVRRLPACLQGRP